LPGLLERYQEWSLEDLKRKGRESFGIWPKHTETVRTWPPRAALMIEKLASGRSPNQVAKTHKTRGNCLQSPGIHRSMIHGPRSSRK
jgi:hypothetical protein